MRCYIEGHYEPSGACWEWKQKASEEDCTKSPIVSSLGGMKTGRFICAFLLTAWCGRAQDAPVDPLVAMGQWNDAINWTSAIRDPLRRLTDHVVTTYGLASLGGITCPLDRSLGADMFREAVEDLNNLPTGSFMESKKVLPVATFSGLWKLVMGPGKKCDPRLQPNDRARARRENERGEVGTYLQKARDLLADNPDRAAQLGQAALEAGDPIDFDMSSFTNFLDDLRGHAPELADNLFQRAIAFELESEIPSIDALAALGDYLFEPASDKVGWGGDRDEADPDLIPLYIGTIAGVLGNGAAVDLAPDIAYAVATQLLPRARELALMDADAIEKFLTQMQAANPGLSPDNQVGGPPPASTLRRIMTQIRGAMEAGRFAEAREMLVDVEGVTMRSRVASFIDFSEAAYAVRGKDADHAMALAGKLPGGVKRALLYAGIVASAENRVTAIMALHLGMKDAELLSYEQRIAMLPALGTAASGVDRDETQAVLSLMIASLNDANANPRKIKFDPTYFFPFDGPRVLMGPDGFVEVVRDERHTLTFPLKVTGVGAYSLADFITKSKGVDFMRLQASVETLRNELQLTRGYLALAKIRLKAGKAALGKAGNQ